MASTRAPSTMRRRTLLGGLGAAAAGALLRSFNAQAQSASSALPQRLLIIHRPCGTYLPGWWPTGGVTDWVASPILKPFEPLRDDMVVLKGVDCPRDKGWVGSQPAAGMIAMISPPPAVGWPLIAGSDPSALFDSNTSLITAGDQSIDQLLLQNVPGLQGAPLGSLQLAASTTSSLGLPGFRDISYARAPAAPFSTPLRPEWDPRVVWQNLNTAMMGRAPGQVSPVDQGVMDFLSADLNRLRPRLPSSQLPKVDSYLDALRSFGKSIGQCQAPTLPALPQSTGFPSQNETQYLEVCRQQALLIKTAFQCDLTRVISLTYAHGESQLNFENILPAGTLVSNTGEYDISQNDALGLDHQAIEIFFSQQTAQLLLALKNTPEGTGSVLDNTLVVYWNNESDGNSHSATDMPILLFGGKFLKLQGGRFLQFQNRYMSDLWVQIAQAWGYSALTQYGAARWNQGPMSELFG
jgi:hypothetical protein